MADDMSYLETLQDIQRELRESIATYELRLLGRVGKATLVEIHLEENEILAEIVRKHNRTLRYLAGLPIEPVAHPAEAILVGVLGGDVA